MTLEQSIHLLAKNATTPEKSAASLGILADRLVDPTRLMKDAKRIPPDGVVPLAWERSVDLWDPDWPDWLKRSLIAAAPADHRRKTTLAGIRRYVSIVGGDLLQAVRPPQGFFAARAPSKAERDAYIRRLPEIRLSTERRNGGGLGLFAGRAFAARAFATPDRARDLLRRRATLIRDGVEIALKLIVLSDGSERITTAGEPGRAPVAGKSFAGRAFLGGSRRNAEIYTVAVGGAHDATGQLRLTAIRPGLLAQRPVIERTSKRLAKGPAVYGGASHAARCFALADRSEEMVFDRLRLFDPEILAPVYGAGGFAGHSRVGIPAYTAQLMIRAEQRGSRRHGHAGRFFAARSHAVPSDLKQLRRIVEAVTLAKAARDHVSLTLQTTRPATLAEGLDLKSGHRFGARLPRNL